jgi:hypothetical protein
MFQTIKVVERIKAHILCSVTFFLENNGIYEMMWENMVETDRLQMTVQYGS